MSLIRRRKSPNPAEHVLGIVRLGLKGLVAQRVARKAYKGYKVGKKLPLVAGAGAAAFVVAKRLKGGSDAPEAEFAPAAAPSPTPPAPEAVPEPPSATPAPDEDGAPPVENSADIAEVVETEATTPAHPAAAGTGGAEGEGAPTDEESAEASGESKDAAPPKD